MNAWSDVEQQRFVVVRNDEGQYSIYPTNRALPPGWNEAGPSGTRTECLDYIEATWADIRPLSLLDSIARDRG